MRFTPTKPAILVAATSILILCSAVGTYMLLSSANTPVDAKQADAARLSFQFDAKQAPGWWSSGNLYPADGLTDDYIGDPSEVPSVDMIVHQGKNRSDASGDCFVSYSYFDHAIDQKAEAGRMKKSVIASSNTLKLQKLDAKTLDLQTPDGLKQYQLQRYDLTGAHNEPIKRGIEHGTITLDDGYISVRGTCTTASQLDDTIPALQAVQFKNTSISH